MGGHSFRKCCGSSWPYSSRWLAGNVIGLLGDVIHIVLVVAIALAIFAFVKRKVSSGHETAPPPRRRREAAFTDEAWDLRR